MRVRGAGELHAQLSPTPLVLYANGGEESSHRRSQLESIQ